MTTDCLSAQEDFNSLISKLPPWVLSNFLHWLDIKLAEYKIFGRILSESERNDAKTYFSKAVGSNSSSAVSVSKARPKSLADHEECAEPHVVSKVPQQKLGPNTSSLNTPYRGFTHVSTSKDLQGNIRTNNFPAQSIQRLVNTPKNVQHLGLIHRIQTDLETPRQLSTEIHGNRNNKDVEYICLDDEKEDTVKIEPIDEEDGETSGRHTDVNRESCPGQKMAVPENQAAGSVSVIKLELPDNEYELLHADVSANTNSDGSENSTSEIPSSTSWGQSLTSNIEVISPESSVMAEIEKSINAGKPKRNRLNSIESKNFTDDIKYENFECTICNRQFQTDLKIVHHLVQDHGIPVVSSKQSVYISRIFKCRFNCGTAFGAKLSRKQHEKVVHSAKTNVCPACNKTFGTKYVFDAHLRQHTGKKLKCSTCEKTFLYPHSLKEHERSCEFGPGANTRFSCDLCVEQGDLYSCNTKKRKYEFKSMKLLKQHFKMVHHEKL